MCGDDDSDRNVMNRSQNIDATQTHTHTTPHTPIMLMLMQLDQENGT
jgi:hypothetical protein